MGLSIYVMNLSRKRVEMFTDDADDSFCRMCQKAPDASLRHGVSKYWDTMFNTPQLYRFTEELESPPSDQVTPVIKQILETARVTIRNSGYLYFVGN